MASNEKRIYRGENSKENCERKWRKHEMAMQSEND
jgi:hypothetical protein